MDVEIERLQVSIITVGDLIISTPEIYKANSVFFFTVKTFLNEKILRANNIEPKQVFFNINVFEKAIDILKKTDYSSYTIREINKNNIELFRKTIFPVGEKIILKNGNFTIVNSKFIPILKVLPSDLKTTIDKYVTVYGALFELNILYSSRNKEDFENSSCKVKAEELNKQAIDVFGFSLSLPGFPTMKQGENRNSSQFNNVQYNNSYSSQYSNINTGNTYNTIYGNTNRKEIDDTREKINKWLKEQIDKNETDRKRLYEITWAENQEIPGNPRFSLDEWISKKTEQDLDNNYKLLWEKYKQGEDKIGKKPNIETFIRKNKNESIIRETERILKDWMNEKQSMPGVNLNINDWLKKKYEDINKYNIRGGNYNIRGGNYNIRGGNYNIRGGNYTRKRKHKHKKSIRRKVNSKRNHTNKKNIKHKRRLNRKI